MTNVRLSRFLSMTNLARRTVVAVTLSQFTMVANICRASLLDNGEDVGHYCPSHYADDPSMGDMPADHVWRAADCCVVPRVHEESRLCFLVQQ